MVECPIVWILHINILTIISGSFFAYFFLEKSKSFFAYFFSKKVSFQSIESLVRGRSRLRKRRAEIPVFFEKNSEK